MSIRRRCTYCDPWHWIDGGGAPGPDDEIVTQLCPDALAAIRETNLEMSEEERKLLLEQPTPPPFRMPPDIPDCDDGIEAINLWSAKIAVLCSIGAIIISLVALIVATFR